MLKTICRPTRQVMKQSNMCMQTHNVQEYICSLRSKVALSPNNRGGPQVTDICYLNTEYNVYLTERRSTIGLRQSPNRTIEFLRYEYLNLALGTFGF